VNPSFAPAQKPRAKSVFSSIRARNPRNCFACKLTSAAPSQFTTIAGLLHLRATRWHLTDFVGFSVVLRCTCVQDTSWRLGSARKPFELIKRAY